MPVTTSSNKPVNRMPVFEMPQEVLQQFDANGGAPGEWLPTIYSPPALRFMWAQWLQPSPKGRQMAAKLVEQVAAEVTAHLLHQEAERQQREAEAAARAEQEAHRLEPGTEVIVRHPRTHADGMPGRVLRMDWRGNTLWATVEVDPCPADHPEAQVPARLRRHFRPFAVDAPAAELRQTTQVPPST